MPKNIILCSDGTGKKGGYGEDTNVYKLYKSVDIHNPDQPQVSYYDNGIGAEENQNKYFRKLAGAFGFGFQGNICDLYEFLARHYNPGDAIYLFGFSRGGATVRAFAGMLYACGLVNRYDNQGQKKSNNELKTDITEAIKAYENIGTDRQTANDYKANKALHDDQYVPEGALPIQFIGVWDTVSALGFPKDWSIMFDWFFSLLDQVSDRIWPHNFYDYELNSTIKHAYQALAIDDERKTFWPKVWDESSNDFSGVVEQVWFSGVHTNVGGGCARTGLSDITMDWMLVRAMQQGLVLKKGVKANVKADTDIYDRLYDSRDGFGIYYRYAPRDIASLSKYQAGGSKLQGKVKVHDTVIQRIKQEVSGYAPGFLPEQFEVVDTPLKASVTSVQMSQKVTTWKDCRNSVRSYTDQRQWLYRIFVELTLITILVSGWLWANAEIVQLEDPNSLNIIERFFGHIADVLQYILPAFFEKFIDYVVRINYWIFVGIVAVTVTMFKWRKHLKRELRQACQKMSQLLIENYKQ